jgi:hypothetical protein
MLANRLGFAAAEFAHPQTVIVASGLAGLLIVALLARPVTRALGKRMPGNTEPSSVLLS